MPDDYLTTIRAMIQHENELRDQRLGWLFALTGLLFTAAGFAWSDQSARGFIIILAIVGALTAISSAAGQAVSDEAIRRLRNDGEAHRTHRDPPIVGARTEHLNEGVARWARLAYPWTWTPVLIFVAWIGVAVAAWRR